MNELFMGNLKIELKSLFILNINRVSEEQETVRMNNISASHIRNKKNVIC